MSRRVPTARLILALAVAPLAPLLVAGAQDVIKPRATLSRLAAPATISAAQQPDGRIRVVWTAVDGAVKYVLLRSVPNLSSGIVALPNSTDTVYVDSDVKAGYTYYYVVNAVDGSGGTGLKRGSTPVAATIGAQSAAAAGPTVTAAITTTTNTGLDIKVSWTPVSGATGYTMHTITLFPLASDSSKPDPASGRIFTPLTFNSMQTSTMTGAGFGVKSWLVFRVTPVLAGGVMGTPGESSPPILVPASTVTSVPVVNTTAGTPVATSLSVTLAIGGTSSLAAQTSIANAQWVSLNPAVATVTSDGTVTGRSAGTARVVSLVSPTTGSVLVKVVQVTVTTQTAPTSPPD